MKIKWCCLFLAQTVGLHFPSLLELEGAKGAMDDVIDEDTRSGIIATPSISASMHFHVMLRSKDRKKGKWAC